jgi:hypothetical protein
MPLLAPDDVSEFDKSPAPAQIPPEPTQDSPSGLDVAAAAFRTSNLLSTLYDTFTNPHPNPTKVAGFDPAVSIPKGYEPYADLFHDVTSPQDMELRRQQIDRENADKRTIANAGGWGLAASMAAGLVDPLTLASMAIPVGGETRLIQAAKTAYAAGLTTAAQEAAMQQLTVTRRPSESALNVAASTVLGGVLGAAFRPHLSKPEFDAMADKLHTELNDEKSPAPQVLGPEEGHGWIVPETSPADIAEYERQAAAAERAASPETQALPPLPKRNMQTPDAREDSILQYLAKHPRGLDSAEAEAQGIDKASFKDATAMVGIKRAFRKGGMSFDEAAEELHQVGYPVNNEEGAYTVNALLDRISDELGGNPQHSTMNTRAELEMAHERMHDEAMRGELHEDAPEFLNEDEATQHLLSIAARARDYDPEAFRHLIDGEQSDAELERGLRAIVDEGRAGEPANIAEYEAAEDQRLSGEARRAPGEETQGLADPPLSIGELHVNPSGESTAGGAAVNTPTLRGETIARGARTLVEGPIGQVAPGGRLMGSPSVESRKLLQELANVPETTEKNYDGVATAQPIERELWKYEGVHYQGMKARGDAFRTYRERIASEKGEPMSRAEFNQEISYAMRRGDKSPIPEVEQAAKETRRIEFEPLKARAVKLGLLPEDVKATGADSYLMRQYDAVKIRGNQSDWLDRLTRGFVGQGMDVAEARDVAHKATRNILGSERGTMDWHALDGIVPQSGQMKERTLKLPDTLLEPYLNSDIDHLAHSYLRSMAPEVEMTERFGSRDMKDRLADVRDDYARMIERAKSDSEKEALINRMDADLRDLQAVRDRLYGIYGQPKDPGSFFVRAGRLLRSENALRLLGAATLSHFPDAANVMMRFGIPQTFAAAAKVLTSKEAFQLTRSEAKRMGAALDMTMNVTASMLGDYGSHSQFLEQRIMNKLTKGFTILTGETPLITATQALTSTIAQNELIHTAMKVATGKSVDKNLLARTAAAGIDEDLLRRIADQHQQFGAVVNGLNFGMSEKWTDQAAASAFESAILRDAHSVTLRPGVGDTPLLMSTELGKTLLQFKSFGYAASRSVLNPMMQGIAHGDPRAAAAFMALVGMGVATYASKQIAAAQPIEPFDSPRLALEVLDKTNLMGWTSEFVFPLLWQAGIKNVSRFGDRDAVETIGGPTAGTVASIYERRLPTKLLGNQVDKNETFNRSDLHFLRRLAPGQNLWFARSHISDLEDAVGDGFDLPGKSNAERAADNDSRINFAGN